MTYKIEELELKDESIEEQIRIREIFLDLKNKARNNQHLSEHEKYYLSFYIRNSLIDTDDEKDFPCLENEIFKRKYLSYWYDLTGTSIYEKAQKGAKVRIPTNEVEEDIIFLKNEAEKWFDIIQESNHKSELLKQISKETRTQLKTLNNLSEFKNDEFIKGSFYYRNKRWSILLLSKYIYLYCLKIIEEIEDVQKDFPFTIKIGNYQIEFNEYSLIHILMRHYAEKAKNYSTNKSYHNPSFQPNQLISDLEDIFIKISPHITNIENPIVFEHNKQLYEIWHEEQTKQIKGTGNVKFRRLETFYPITNSKRIQEIKSLYTKVKIVPEIYFFKYCC